MNRLLHAGCLLFFAALFLPAHALADTKPAWVLSLDRPVRWFRGAPEGVLLVGTDQEIMGIRSDDGSVRWRLGPAEDSEGRDVEPLAPLPYALVSLGERKAPSLPATFLIDVRDGHTIWAADSLGVGWSIGSWLLPGNDRLLLRAALKPKGKAQTAMLVDVRTGNRIWTRQELGENFDPEPVVSARIRGYERPLLDTDSTMILFSNSKTLRKYDLRTGELLWQSTDLPPPSAGLLERLGDATEAGKDEAGKKSGDRFYAPYLKYGLIVLSEERPTFVEEDTQANPACPCGRSPTRIREVSRWSCSTERAVNAGGGFRVKVPGY